MIIQILKLKKFFTIPLIKNEVDGGVSGKVKYLTKNHEFTATQLLAMYLDKIKILPLKKLKVIFLIFVYQFQVGTLKNNVVLLRMLVKLLD